MSLATTDISRKKTEIVSKGDPIQRESEVKPDAVSYEDIGGCKRYLAEIRETIELPLRHPSIFKTLGVSPPKGVLLYGPSGTTAN